MATTATKRPAKRRGNMRPLFDGAEWTFELIQKVHDTMGEIAIGELGLDIYPNQIEVITAEQMLDSYSSIGMPLMYRHWSFGKRFARDEAYYKRGMRSLAYELVINSDPCISSGPSPTTSSTTWVLPRPTWPSARSASARMPWSRRWMRPMR